MVIPYAADIEVSGLWVCQVKATYAGGGCHRQAVRQPHVDVAGLQQVKQGALHAVVWARGVAGGRSNALVLLSDELLVGQRLACRIAPPVGADAVMHHLGHGFGQPIG